MLVTHSERINGLTLRLAVAELPEEPEALIELVAQHLYRARSMYSNLLVEEQVHPIKVEWVRPQQLETNDRKGKLKRIIDLRFGAR